MDELIQLGIEDKKGVLVVSSRKIAEVFEKRHADILRAIENLECSEAFRQRNFASSSYKNEQNKKQPEYLITFDGFVFLTMGFTGFKAAQFKEAYIKEFNRRGDELKTRQIGKDVRHELTDVLNYTGIDDAMYGHAYENVTNNIIYKIAFGKPAQKIREERGLARKANVREHLGPGELKLIARIEEAAKVLFELGYSYQEVKQMLMERIKPELQTIVYNPFIQTMPLEPEPISITTFGGTE